MNGFEAALREISLIVLDVDGVLTDGRIILNAEGLESKNFYVRDGLAIAEAVKAGFKLAIISGRHSQVVQLRAQELKIHDVHQGIDDKLKVFKQVVEKHGLTTAHTAFMGDDVNDLAVLNAAGFAAAPADADQHVREKARWTSRFNGGAGAVRELIEMIMRAQHKWPYAETR